MTGGGFGVGAGGEEDFDLLRVDGGVVLGDEVGEGGGFY